MKHKYLRRISILLVIVFIAVGAAILRSHRIHQAAISPTAELSPWAIETGTVKRGNLGHHIESVATIEAVNIISLTPQIQGTAIWVGPRAGAHIKQGQLLVKIDARSIVSNIASLQEQFRAAKADAIYAAKQQVRINALFEKGMVNHAQADAARANVDGARAREHSLSNQISTLRVQLGYAQIRAPQNGHVAKRLIAVGDTVSPAKPVYQLTAGAGAVVRVSLPAADMGSVHVGDKLIVKQHGIHLTLNIDRVAPAVNEAGLGRVESDAPQVPFDLPSGSTVNAEIQLQSQSESLIVPPNTVIGTGKGAHVLVFVPGNKPEDSGHLRRVSVKILAKSVEGVAIEGALSPGEQVAVGQIAFLSKIRNGDSAISASSRGKQ